MPQVAAVILAAGQGTRMKSENPKVLHPVNGVPLIQWTTDLVKNCRFQRRVVVLPPRLDAIKPIIGKGFAVAIQANPKGTGHALMQVQKILKGFQGDLVVLYGDMPLLKKETLEKLVKTHQQSGAEATLLTANLPNPFGYGRIVRGGQGNILRVVEELDATPEQRRIQEVNTGYVCYKTGALWPALSRIGSKNAKGEYYLTDVVHALIETGKKVQWVSSSVEEVWGVNDRVQLARAAKILRLRYLEELMKNGVTIEDPDSTFIDKGARIGRDTVIRPCTFIDSMTVVGKHCEIGPFSRLTKSRVEDKVFIMSSTIDSSTLKKGCRVGPYCRVRNHSVIGEQAYLGNFVEIKNSKVGRLAMISHFSYLGDTTLGRKANIGAGTVTANFDGVNKNRTVIRDGAFIGSNTTLVAPVRIGAGAKTGAGSVVLKKTKVPSRSVVVGVPARLLKKKREER